MRDINTLKTFITTTSSFLIKEDNIAFYTLFENDNFMDQFPLLNIPRRYVKYAKLLHRYSVRGKYIFNKENMIKLKNKYKILKQDPNNSNNYYHDLTEQIDLIGYFLKTNFRSNKQMNMYKKVFEDNINPSKKKYLIYGINIDEGFQSNIFLRKIYPILRMMRYYIDGKNDYFPFDKIFLLVYSPKLMSNDYVKLFDSEDNNHNYTRLISTLKKITPIELDEETKKDEIVQDVSEFVQKNKESFNIDNDNDYFDNKEKLETAISRFLNKEPDTNISFIHAGIKNDRFDKNELIKWVKTQVNTIKTEDKPHESLKKIEEEETKNSTEMKNILTKVDSILPDREYDDREINHNIQQKNINVNKNIIGKNNQSKILDFQNEQYKEFSDQIKIVFKDLEKGNYPLKLKKFEMSPIEAQQKDVYESNLDNLKITLEDENGKTKTMNLKIPKLTNDGYYYLDGNKRKLISQFIPFPVYIYKPHHCRIQTQHSTINVIQRMTTGNKYIITYIAGKRFPLVLLFISYLGFDQFLKFFNIKLKTSEKNDIKYDKELNKTPNGIYQIKSNDVIYQFEYDQSDEYKYYLLNGLSRINFDKENYQIDYNDYNSDKTWNNILAFYTQDTSTKFKIKKVLDYIIDSLSARILENREWPTNINNILKRLLPMLITEEYFEQNDLKNYRARNYEQISSIIRNNVMKEYQMYENEKRAGLEQNFSLNPNIVTKSLKTAQLSQSLEYINPIEYISFIDRITYKGEGSGLTNESVENNDSFRHLHESYYKIVDPLDTPEGGTIGIVQHLTTNTNILDSKGLLNLSKIDNDNENIFGMTLSTVPFSNNSEPTRMLMATAHQKQQLPLVNQEMPLTQTGYEELIPNMLSNDFIIKTKFDNGIIKEITDEYIIIKNEKTKEEEKFDIRPKKLKGGQSLNIVSKFKVNFKPGDRVTKNDIIQNFQGIQNGTMAQGINIWAQYMMWKGYTYEDGLVISDDLQERFKIEQFKEKYIILNEGDQLIEIKKPKDSLNKNDVILKYKPQRIYEMQELDETDESISDGLYELYQLEQGEVLSIDVFGDIEKFENVGSIKKYYDGSKKYIKEEPLKDKLVIKINYSENRGIKIGDKLANRHGNKGVVTYIEKKENMPITPWGDKIEIILNPLGVIGRTNTGQIYELYTNLIQKFVQRRLKELNSNKDKVELIEDIYLQIDNTKGQKLYLNIKQSLNQMNEEKLNDYFNNIEQNGFVIYEPPFNTTNQEQILNQLDKLGIKSKYKLYLPEYESYTQRDIQIGLMYQMRLEHLSTLKLGQTGKQGKDSRTGQQTKRAGDKQQRIGEQDTYSLLQYDQKKVLGELFNQHSDDIKQSNKMYNNILTDGQTDLVTSEQSKSKDYLEQYLLQMGVNPDETEKSDDLLI